MIDTIYFVPKSVKRENGVDLIYINRALRGSCARKCLCHRISFFLPWLRLSEKPQESKSFNCNSAEFIYLQLIWFLKTFKHRDSEHHSTVTCAPPGLILWDWPLAPRLSCCLRGDCSILAKGAVVLNFKVWTNNLCHNHVLAPQLRGIFFSFWEYQ